MKIKALITSCLLLCTLALSNCGTYDFGCGCKGGCGSSCSQGK